MTLTKILLPVCVMLSSNLKAQNTPPSDSVSANGVRIEKVEVEANFTGGEPAWRNYLAKNLNPNVPANNDAPSGKYTVIVQFVVGKDGAVSNIKALTNLGFGMEDEVIRILEKSGKWTPAMQNGRPVNAYRKQPITFLIEGNGYEIKTKVPYTLFIGINNEITVDAGKVSKENLAVTISKGTITEATDGKYIVNVPPVGRVTIILYNRKKDKEIGAASFEVKRMNKAEMKH